MTTEKSFLKSTPCFEFTRDRISRVITVPHLHSFAHFAICDCRYVACWCAGKVYTTPPGTAMISTSQEGAHGSCFVVSCSDLVWISPCETTLKNRFQWIALVHSLEWKMKTFEFWMRNIFFYGLIDNITIFVQIMAWCRTGGNRPLSETMMVCLMTNIYVTRPQARLRGGGGVWSRKPRRFEVNIFVLIWKPAKFQCDLETLNTDLAPSRLGEILR